MGPMRGHLIVASGFLALALAAGALWAGLAGEGAERARPGDRLLVWVGEPAAAPGLIAASGQRPVDALLGGRLWVFAADGPLSAPALRDAGARAVLAQPTGALIGLGGCGPVFLPRAPNP